jgi:hypothetical protein
MAESKPEQIKARLAEVLRAIVGDGGTTYWQTPSAVYRCWGRWSDEMLQKSLATPAVIYAVRSGTHRTLEYTTGGGTRGELEVFILLARADQAPNVAPAKETAPIRDTLAERMERDVVKALLTDVNLRGTSSQGLVDNVMGADGITSQDIPDVEGGWIVRELHMVMEYQTLGSAP